MDSEDASSQILTLQNTCEHNLKDKIQSAFLFEQLIDNHLRINFTSRLFVKKVNPSDGFAQVLNQLGTPEVAKSVLRGAEILQTMSNSFQLYPTDFSRGSEKVCRGGFVPLPPLVTGLCPIVLKYVQHIVPGGAKNFLARYGPGFAS